MIEDFSAHGKKEALSPLRHVWVYILPKNTTCKVQPLDAGIIACVKDNYKRRLLFSVFDNIDMGHMSILNVNILCPMRLTDEEWNKGPASLIKNCFEHCLKQIVVRTEE